ncbi:hypothetical protein KKC32_05320 [Patescibacteria group bacterium]|nr:hypothetical protein [Patescibacteria group bacterium]
MNVLFLREFYHNVRNTFIWILLYFIVQALIWLALAVLVFMYPESLAILFGVFFVILSVVCIYSAILVSRYAMKLKALKDMIVDKL